MKRILSLTEDELRAASTKLREIESIREALLKARQKLRLFNEHGVGKTWTVRIQLKAPEHAHDNNIEQIVVVPAKVIQRQMVDECERLRRKLFALGGKDK